MSGVVTRGGLWGVGVGVWGCYRGRCVGVSAGRGV